MAKAIVHLPGEPLPHVAHVPLLRPVRWLRRGLRDFLNNPGAALAHGVLLVAVLWVVLFLFSAHIDLFTAAITGLALVGPVFVAAFYEMSRLREAGRPVSFDASVTGAWRNGRPLARLGLLLAAIAVLWMALSTVLFEHAFGVDLPMIGDRSWMAVFEWDQRGFVTSYFGTGAVLAAIAFVIAAVSAPAIFDGRLDTTTAVLTSVKAVATNPFAMTLWAALVALLLAAGIATLLIGLVVVLPVLGHATWHAYRDLLPADEPAARPRYSR